MPTLEVNLNEVVEKPRLPAGQPFTFAIQLAEAGIAKNANTKTGVREAQVIATLVVLDQGWEHVKFKKYWSMSPGALSSDDPTFSIKKFFSIVGYAWNPDGSFATEDLQTIRFVGTVKYKEGSNYPDLASVLRGA
jgi:hypothetical protein